MPGNGEISGQALWTGLIKHAWTQDCSSGNIDCGSKARECWECLVTTTLAVHVNRRLKFYLSKVSITFGAKVGTLTFCFRPFVIAADVSESYLAFNVLWAKYTIFVFISLYLVICILIFMNDSNPIFIINLEVKIIHYGRYQIIQTWTSYKFYFNIAINLNIIVDVLFFWNYILLSVIPLVNCDIILRKSSLMPLHLLCQVSLWRIDSRITKLFF